ncbi:DNA internalization-related competence protein ComEC/Rec2 [Lentibacillus sp. Marseille-P4043]|uniref:DNA internalization-related competence protein ComEC/Rec2 n=1 Tax=Lentibacillus sp. Marseille-P4043 TaxID=2040293 RepID=UPI000D0AD659|nr:DNA internalization-related competence protein ComEC/Rec2 [Lentibacillus sp. Marseille-P4043]
MKGYWHFPAISVAMSILTIIFHTFWFAVGLILWLLLLYVFNRLGKVPIIISLTLFLFFYTFIPTITPIEQPTSNDTVSNLSGKIVGSINNTAKKVDFVLRDQLSKTKFLVVYFTNEEENIRNKNIAMLKDGASCQLKGKVERPDGSRNPGQFDYHNYLLSQGIDYQVTLDSLEDISCSGSSAMANIYEVRTKAIRHIHEQVSSETAAWLTALVLGDDSMISDDTIELFQRWGLSHLLAISGLHVGLIITLLYFILIKLNLLTKEKAQWVMIFFLPFYAIVAGGEPSVWRASVMAMVFIVLAKLKLQYSVTDALSIVFFLLILANKYIVYSVGFQLSFLVTFGLLLSKRWLAETSSPVFLVLQISFVSQMMILPLQVAYFYTFQPLSIVLNIVVVPYFSIFVIPLMFLLLVISPVSGLLLSILDRIFVFVHGIFISVIQAVDQTSYFPFVIGSITIVGALLYYCLFFLFMKQTQQKKLSNALQYGCFLTIFIIGITLKPYFSQTGSVTMLDIGQGDAFIIELPYRRGVIMVDAGAKVTFGEEKSSDKNYRQIIRPYLLSKGISKIDAVFLSHEDTDHIGSVPFLIEEMDVEKVIVSNFFQFSEKQASQWTKNGLEIQRIEKNQLITIANQSFSVLSPNAEKATANENSLVVYTELGGLSWLFTGDIDKNTEQEMLADYPNLTVDVLKVAHHGSNTSTDQALLTQIAPTYALISVGKNNAYGHPANEVLDKLEAEGIYLLRTDLNGAVTFRYQGKQGTFFKFLP